MAVRVLWTIVVVVDIRDTPSPFGYSFDSLALSRRIEAVVVVVSRRRSAPFGRAVVVEKGGEGLLLPTRLSLHVLQPLLDFCLFFILSA